MATPAEPEQAIPPYPEEGEVSAVFLDSYSIMRAPFHCKSNTPAFYENIFKPVCTIECTHMLSNKAWAIFKIIYNITKCMDSCTHVYMPWTASPSIKISTLMPGMQHAKYSWIAVQCISQPNNPSKVTKIYVAPHRMRLTLAGHGKQKRPCWNLFVVLNYLQRYRFFDVQILPKVLSVHA